MRYPKRRLHALIIRPYVLYNTLEIRVYYGFECLAKLYPGLTGGKLGALSRAASWRNGFECCLAGREKRA
jgi:hypothetical protein